MSVYLHTLSPFQNKLSKLLNRREINLSLLSVVKLSLDPGLGSFTVLCCL